MPHSIRPLLGRRVSLWQHQRPPCTLFVTWIPKSPQSDTAAFSKLYGMLLLLALTNRKRIVYTNCKKVNKVPRSISCSWNSEKWESISILSYYSRPTSSSSRLSASFKSFLDGKRAFWAICNASCTLAWASSISIYVVMYLWHGMVWNGMGLPAFRKEWGP